MHSFLSVRITVILRMQVLISLFFFCTDSWVDAQASRLRFDPPSSTNGLSENTVRKIFLDSRGFIWIATQDGLNRYDGYSYTIFNHESNNPHSISDNFINEIREDKHGNIWIGTRNGLNVYRYLENDFIRFMPSTNPDSSGLKGNYVLSITEGTDGSIWVGTDGGGLNHLTMDTLPGKDGQKTTRFHFENYSGNCNTDGSLCSNSVFNLAFDALGNLWIGTDNGMNELSKEEIQKPASNRSFSRLKWVSSRPENKNNQIIYALTCTDKGTWFGTGNGEVFCIRTEEGKNNTVKLVYSYQKPEGDQENRMIAMNDLLVLQDESMWVASSAGLLHCIPDSVHTEKYSCYSYQNEIHFAQSLPSNYVTCLCKDASGMLWIGTTEGTALLDPWKNRFHTREMNVFGRDTIEYELSSMLQDERGNFWFGTQSYGVRILDPAGKSHQLSALKSLTVTTLFQDKRGDVWLGSSNGLARVKKNDLYTANGSGINENVKADFFNHLDKDSSSLPSNLVMAIEEDRNGGLWVGTGKGIGFIDSLRKKCTRINISKENTSLFSEKITRSIYVDKKNEVWICTDGGLFRLDESRKKISHYANVPGDSSSIAQTRLNCIHEDRKGRLWLGTNGGGLVCFNPTTGKCTMTYSVVQGLPNNVINSIEEDENGRLWVSTNKGISRIDPDQNTLFSYGFKDGLVSDEFNPNASMKTADGTLFFGSDHGYSAFNPEKIITSNFVPPIVLTDVKIFDASVFEGPNSYLRKAFLTGQPIHLAPNQNSISFEFAALNFMAPEKNKYTYRLEGFDQDWIQAGSRRFASYTNLDPGTYTFHVLASNNDGIWNEKGISYQFTIEEPFYRTLLFKVLLAILISLIVFFINRARLRNLELKKEKEIAVKTTQLKEQFLANMSHEIRTPLNAILGMTRLLREKKPNPDQLKYLDAIMQSSDNLLVIINDILDISKIDAGRIELETIPFSLRTTLKGVFNTLRFKSEEKGLAFSYEIPEYMTDYYIGDPVRLSQMLINLTGNAIKFTAKGSVKIICECEPPTAAPGEKVQVLIHVSDTGIGIAPENREKVFDIFTQESSDTTRKFGGTGLGLAISKKLAELHHGTIDLKSEVGKGTTFTISIPYEVAEAPAVPIHQKAQSESLREALKGLRILLVEDNDFNRIVAIDTLEEELSDLTIDVAVNGIEAVQKAEKQVYDIILMDVQMPEMNGYDATKAIRQLPAPFCESKIIAMTAGALKEEVERCFQAGMNDFIAKPFDPEDLLNKMQGLISR